jgi:hypothetical protein
MPEQNYTQDGLPVVSEETIKAMDAIFPMSKKSTLKDFKEYLIKENPNLVRIMDEFVMFDETGSVEFLYGFLSGMQIMYESLRRQSAANKLEREIEGK